MNPLHTHRFSESAHPAACTQRLLMVLLCGLLAATTACGNDSGGGGSADATINDDSGIIDVKADAVADDADADSSVSDTSGADATVDTTDSDVANDTAADATALDTTNDTANDTAPTCLKWAGGCVDMNCKAIGEAKNALYKQVISDGAKACSVKGDCVMLNTNTACTGTCGTAVHKDTADVLKALVSSFYLDVCQVFDAAGKCGYSTPSCTQPDPTCEAGVCVYAPTKPVGNCTGPQPDGTICEGSNWVCAPGYFKGYGETACHEATCETMSAALNAIKAVGGEAAKACQLDDDCTAIDVSTACQGACPMAVNSGMANDVLKAIGWFNDNVCVPFDYAKQCGFSTPKCLAPNVGCDAGVCVYSK